jgi:hypothetical protein
MLATMPILPIAVAFVLGVAAWLVPLAAFALAFFFSVGNHDVGMRELLLVAGLAALVTLAAPLGLMAWQRWHHAAMAYAAGMVVGTGPLIAFLAWLAPYVIGRR